MLLHLVIGYPALVHLLYLILSRVAPRSRLHHFHVHTGLAHRMILTCNLGMIVLRLCPAQSTAFLLVDFRSLRELGRLLRREEEGVVSQHLAIDLLRLWVRLLAH